MVAANQSLLFDDLGPRRVQADFSGGTLSSDGGVLLIRQVDRSLGLSTALAHCFTDRRHPDCIDHSVAELLRQRIYGLALGYEDLNDHEQLRRDPLLAAACEKRDPLGQNRLHPTQDKGIALAGPSTLNRLELSNNKDSRYHKIEHQPQLIEQCLLTLAVKCLPKHASEIILDLDAMGHRLYGQQQGRNFHRYYDDYCYLPLYIFAGDVPLWAQLRPSDVDPIEGVVPALEKVVAAIRRRCRKARILVRGDCGFSREELMHWCESQAQVYYCLGFARNPALQREVADALANARTAHCLSGGAMVRRFADFQYQTCFSWSRRRRMVGKAEVSKAAQDVRFVLTNLPANGFAGDEDRARFVAERLYEELYCGRGEMENKLKQQVLDLEADRMSTHFLASNQLRLWFATLAYLLIERMRSWGLAGTELAQATAGTIRVKLLKVAGQVRVTVRRVSVQLSSAWAWRDLFTCCAQRLATVALDSG
jgi:hypothetical protein